MPCIVWKFNEKSLMKTSFNLTFHWKDFEDMANTSMRFIQFYPNWTDLLTNGYTCNELNTIQNAFTIPTFQYMRTVPGSRAQAETWGYLLLSYRVGIKIWVECLHLSLIYCRYLRSSTPGRTSRARSKPTEDRTVDLQPSSSKHPTTSSQHPTPQPPIPTPHVPTLEPPCPRTRIIHLRMVFRRHSMTLEDDIGPLNIFL